MKACIFQLFFLLSAAKAKSFDIDSFLNKPLIVQQIKNETVKNSFVGFFNNSSDQNMFVSKYVNQMAQNFASACISKISSNCKYESSYQEILFNQFRINFASTSKAAKLS